MQPPAVAHERAQQLVLDRGEVDLLAVAAHDPRGEVDLEAVGADGRLVVGLAGAAQDRAQARDELARAERLREVVVGARFEREHLLVLLPDRRQDEDRHAAPLAQAPADVDAAAVGEHEVDDRRARRAQRGRVERLGRGGGGDGLEAGVAQDDAQGAQDLQLVVADEHAWRVAHPAASPTASGARDGAGSSGNSITNVVPWPGSDSTRMRAPLTVSSPRAMASPRPEPRWPARSVPAR